MPFGFLRSSGNFFHAVGPNVVPQASTPRQNHEKLHKSMRLSPGLRGPAERISPPRLRTSTIEVAEATIAAAGERESAGCSMSLVAAESRMVGSRQALPKTRGGVVS